jgi:hypothetical protein
MATLSIACSGEMGDGDVGTYMPPTRSGPPAADAGYGGSSAGAGGASPSSDAGTGYDPGVTFVWPEADPTRGVCRSGTYTGQFNCQMSPGGPFPTGPYGGPVTFLLKQSANGEFLEIEDGILRGTVAGWVVEFVSELVGELDCKTNQFQAQVVNGTFFGGTFVGGLVGKLDRSTQTVTGTWNMGIPFAPPCIGPFTVVRSP